MMKNVFYLMLNPLFALNIFKFSSWFFAHVKKPDLIRKIRLISKFMTSQPGYQTIKNQILRNISRRKNNKAMKFDQLIEYDQRNISPKKSCTK